MLNNKLYKFFNCDFGDNFKIYDAVFTNIDRFYSKIFYINLNL